MRIEVSGVRVEINERVVRDYRLLAMLAEAEESPAASLRIMPRIADMLFGREQFERILKAVEERDGYADIEVVQGIIIEAFTSAARGDEPPMEDDSKNS